MYAMKSMMLSSPGIQSRRRTWLVDAFGQCIMTKRNTPVRVANNLILADVKLEIFGKDGRRVLQLDIRPRDQIKRRNYPTYEIFPTVLYNHINTRSLGPLRGPDF